MGKSQGGSGGAAASGGMEYQHRVAAWLAVQILGEAGASLPWGLPDSTKMDFIRCETEQPVDDILVGTSDSGVIYAQVKRSLNLSHKSNSDLASALSQFVKQFLACQRQSAGHRPWKRQLDAEKDRLALVTGPRSSAPVRLYLPRVLNRLRELTRGQSIDDSAKNKNEMKALNVAVTLARRSWLNAIGTEPSDIDVRQVLSFVHVQVLDVEDGGSQEREAKETLRNVVLRSPDKAVEAWTHLIVRCTQLASQQSGTDRPGLQRALLNAGIDLNVPRSFRPDIDKLRDVSRRTASQLRHFSHIRFGAGEIKIARQSTHALRCAIDDGSLLVVGEPGAGKSGALHDLADMLLNEGHDVVFLAADHLAAGSFGELRTELGLDHELDAILSNWPGTASAFLIIDALDAARAEGVSRTLRSLIRGVKESEGRWQVIASIRKFDLRYGKAS